MHSRARSLDRTDGSAGAPTVRALHTMTYTRVHASRPRPEIYLLAFHIMQEHLEELDADDASGPG